MSGATAGGCGDSYKPRAPQNYFLNGKEPWRNHLLEVFDAARHARPITCADYPFIVQTSLSDMRLRSMQRRKECDTERVRCAKGSMREGYGEREL